MLTHIVLTHPHYIRQRMDPRKNDEQLKITKSVVNDDVNDKR